MTLVSLVLLFTHTILFHSNSMLSYSYILYIFKPFHSLCFNIFLFINRSIIACIHSVWFVLFCCFFFNFYDFQNDKFPMNEFDFADIHSISNVSAANHRFIEFLFFYRHITQRSFLYTRDIYILLSLMVCSVTME